MVLNTVVRDPFLHKRKQIGKNLGPLFSVKLKQNSCINSKLYLKSPVKEGLTFVM